jgi:3-phenylpropionate/trans-cinnamate dioxygenase ferredoxin reductase subunit
MKHDYDVVVVGAGHAGINVVAHLTRGGFTGSVGLLSDESCLPYKRPPLSKGYLLGTESSDNLALRSGDYWAHSAARLINDARVRRVDPDRCVVLTESGDEVSYGRLVWAAGGRARSLPTPGIELAGVHSLRTLSDADRLKAQMWAARRAIVVGGGYIGLEIAAAFRGLGLDVTVVESGPRVLERVTSGVVSDFFHRLHRYAGIDLRLRTAVIEFRGTGQRLTSAVLSDGTEMGCDIAVVGVGMEPNVEVLADAGATCGNGVDVDEFGRTALDGVSAAGDCSNQLHPYGAARRIRVESVHNASEQAKVVASDLLGKPMTAREVPWFWSDQYDVKFKAAGISAGYDTLITRGDPTGGSFAVLYLARGQLIAIDCIDRPTDFSHGRALIKSGARIRHDDFADPERPLQLAMR